MHTIAIFMRGQLYKTIFTLTNITSYNFFS